MRIDTQPFDRAAHLKRLADAKRGVKRDPEIGRKISAAKAGRLRGWENPNWRGGVMMVDGYKYLYRPDHPHRTKLGYVAEHRLVMEDIIGRPIMPGEAVHHIDGNTQNNAPENLQLFRSNGRHTIECHAVRNSKGQFKCA